MIGRVLWALFVRFYGAGVNVSAEMLDAIEVAIAEESAP